MALAARTALRTASAFEMSGAGASLCTAIAALTPPSTARPSAAALPSAVKSAISFFGPISTPMSPVPSLTRARTSGAGPKASVTSMPLLRPKAGPRVESAGFTAPALSTLRVVMSRLPAR